jgi:hypothetical protein
VAKANTGLPYEVIRLNAWEDFLAVIAKAPYHNWAFRGQKDSAPLFSALSRYLLTYGINPSVWMEQEERILRIFKRKAVHFLDHAPERDDDFQWLALMQDHGAPTRLVDFTWSPYVAAFFALHNATGEAVIWACNPFEIERHKKLDLNQPGSFAKHFLSSRRSFVWMGEPYAMNRRLIAQSGTFLVPSVLDRPIDDILANYPKPKGTLVKFLLSPRIREKGMRELYKMNITQASLFPDLDGLARSLAFELEFHWAYDPKSPCRVEW